MFTITSTISVLSQKFILSLSKIMTAFFMNELVVDKISLKKIVWAISFLFLHDAKIMSNASPSYEPANITKDFNRANNCDIVDKYQFDIVN